MNLYYLPGNRLHVERIASIYFDLSKPLHLYTDIAWSIFLVVGTGYDGESQRIRMGLKGEIRREHLRQFVTESCRLPVSNGRILAMLLDLGYELPIRQTIRGQRYKQYLSTGISFLGKH